MSTANLSLHQLRLAANLKEKITAPKKRIAVTFGENRNPLHSLRLKRSGTGLAGMANIVAAQIEMSKDHDCEEII
jgi:hypothetical protein